MVIHRLLTHFRLGRYQRFHRLALRRTLRQIRALDQLSV